MKDIQNVIIFICMSKSGEAQALPAHPPPPALKIHHSGQVDSAPGRIRTSSDSNEMAQKLEKKRSIQVTTSSTHMPIHSNRRD